VIHDEDGVRLWSRNGTDLSGRFPGVAAAAVPPGTVLDCEVVIWDGARLSFDLLDARMAPPPRSALLVSEHPASFVAFDVLASGVRQSGVPVAR
jgi:ATP-dependent DNA ligase